MLKGANPNFYDFAEQQFISGLNLTQQHHQQPVAQYNDAIDEAIYGSDEFRMYAYKIKRCTRMRSHDWTDCPYAHRGEKAQRRDPRKVSYSAIACPAFRNGKCLKGDACEFAHGVFEYWLHPSRYRTRACNAGRFCQHKVCFFAHKPEQLRSESKYRCFCAYKGRVMNSGDYPYCHHHHQQQHFHHHRDPRLMMEMAPDSGEDSMQMVPMQMVAHHEHPSVSPMINNRESCLEGVSDLLKNLRALKMWEEGEEEEGREMMKKNNNGFEVLDSDLPHLDWISELVK